MAVSFGTFPDEVLIAVLRPHVERCQCRAVSRHWCSTVNEHFKLRHFRPPCGRHFCLDFEYDRGGMSKDMFCAQFSFCDEAGMWQGHVAYLNWVPVYYRSAPGARRDLRHALSEVIICGLWRRVARLLEDRALAKAGRIEGDGGHLVVTQGCGGAEDNSTENITRRHVVGRLSTTETADLLNILDHRRNAAAMRLPEP